MGLEIERKFLVNIELLDLTQGEKKEEIIQGYLNYQEDSKIFVRVRVINDKAWLTVKKVLDDSRLVRMEYEYPIPVKEAKEMLEGVKIVKKTRYTFGKFTVDVFDDLVLAEIEFENEEESEIFYKPEWLGKEVTGNLKYYSYR